MPTTNKCRVGCKEAASLTEGAGEIGDVDEAVCEGLLDEGFGSALSTIGGGDVTVGGAADGAGCGGIGVKAGGVLGRGAEKGGLWAAS